MSLRYLSIGPVNLGFGAADLSYVVGSEHEQYESGLRVPVARLVMLASHCQRSGALRSRDGLGSASSMSESAAGCVVRGLLVEGSSGEGRALPAAMRAATRHAPFLLRQLAHFSSFDASRGHHDASVRSFLAASLRFIGAKRPFARRGHLRTAQLRTQRITEMRGNGRHSCVRTFRRSGARRPSLCATQTLNADVRF